MPRPGSLPAMTAQPTYFGVFSTAQLSSFGQTRANITQLTKAGKIIRLRNGWYALPNADNRVARAVTLGGALTGPSALRLHGAWTPPNLGLNVRASRHDRVRKTLNVTSHALRGELSRPISTSVDDVFTALLVTIRDFDTESAVILADSALQRGLISSVELEHIISLAGPAGRPVIRSVNGKSESGTESRFRLWLGRKGIKYTVQSKIPGVGRVDFLIGKRLVVEIDSVSHHTSEESYRNDRRRDRRLVRLGYVVIRLTYEEVMFELDSVGQDVLAVIRRDGHRYPPRSLRVTASKTARQLRAA